MRTLRKRRARSRLAEEYLAWEKQQTDRPRSATGKSEQRRRSASSSTPPKTPRDSYGSRKSPRSHSHLHSHSHSHSHSNSHSGYPSLHRIREEEPPPRKKSRHILRRRSPHENIAVDYKSRRSPDRSKRRSKHYHSNHSDSRSEQKESTPVKIYHSTSKSSRHSHYVESPPKKSPRSPDRSKRKSRYSPTSSDTYVNPPEPAPVVVEPKRSPDRSKRKSRHAQVNADACLDRLPVELKLSILEALPDVPSLYSITRASPAFYHAYAARKYRIHSKVITADVDSEILIEALSLLQASRISRSSRWLEKAQSFIDLYEIDRSLLVGPEIAGKETMHRIAGFHIIIHNITSRFSQECLSAHPVIGRSSLRSEKALSPTEIRRFQRSLYRYEIFCRLFGGLHRTPEDYVYDQIGFARVATDFLASFQPWEAEEMNTVHRFVCKYYRRAIRKCSSYLNVEFGRSQYGEKVVVRAPNGQYQYKLERDWYREAAERCASMGLSFLSKIINTSSTKSRAKLLTSPIFAPDISGEILPLVWKKSYTLDFGPGPVFGTSYGKPDLEFLSENSGPNAGIVWAGSMVFSLREEWPNKNWLLGWGVVMWDWERLDRWSVLTKGYRYIADVLRREQEDGYGNFNGNGVPVEVKQKEPVGVTWATPVVTNRRRSSRRS